MTVIDIHTHIFPDRVAGPAMASLEAESPITPVFDGTLAGLLAAMDRGGIERAATQPVATRPSAVRSINDWAASIAGERIAPFGAMHPDLEDPGAEAARMAELGLPGFKMHPEFQRFRPDDFARMAPIYEAAVEHGLILFFHAGLDIAIPTCNSTPQIFARVNDGWPQLTLVLAHLGGWKQWDDVLKHLVGRELYLDTSFALGYTTEEQVLDIIAAHGHERIVFGSDAPWADGGGEAERIRALGLAPAVLDAVLWRNAARLLDSRSPA